MSTPEPDPEVVEGVAAVLDFLDMLYLLVDNLRAGDPPPPPAISDRIEEGMQSILTAITEAKEMIVDDG